VQSSIGFKTEPSMAEQSIRSGAVFALLAIGLVLSAYAYRYVQRQRLTGSHRRLKVLETLPLAPKTRLFLVEMDHRVILLGQHGTTLSVLADHVPLNEGSELPARADSP
jgi:flagellar biogenesis protein FliO